MREVGRPPRTNVERARTAAWAVAVAVQAKCEFRRLETVLGPDGRWTGVWSRYVTLRVSPTKDRVERIDRVLPGSARIFFSCIWKLVAHDELLPSELRQAVNELDPRIAVAFVADDHSSNGMFWRLPTSWDSLLELALHHLNDEVLCLDAALALMILLREAQLRQDGAAYIAILHAWAKSSVPRRLFPTADQLTKSLLPRAAEILRKTRFADATLHDRWMDHFDEYCFAHDKHIDNFNIVDCLRWNERDLEIDDLCKKSSLTQSLFIES